MFPSYMNKPAFMTNTPNTSFGASTSTFGQPTTNTPMFPSMQPSNLFQTSMSSFNNPGTSTQSTFGTPTIFSQPQSQPAANSLFGTGNAFGQSKSTFGFGAAQPQTTLFGQQQPQQPPTNTLFQSSAPNLFGSNSFGNQTTGTVIKFSPVTGSDTMQKSGITTSISTKHHCITCMKEYEGKSLEELRFEDYSVNRKGPQQTGFAASTPFANTNPPTNALFGQTDNKQTFGQPQGFGQANTSLFGKPNTFGATTSSTPSFGFNTTPATTNPFSAATQTKPFSQPLFGTANPQPQPTFGAQNVFGTTGTQNSATSLFQKPAQPTTGFSTGQPGFSFSQPSTTQPSNLFQVSKPSTGFGMFGQTNTTALPFGQSTQPTFASTFGKPPQAATTNLFGGMISSQQVKPPMFGLQQPGGTLFNNNVFQQTPAFSLNANQQPPVQFPQESDESKNISLVTNDAFPDGCQFYGLQPSLSDSSARTTLPKDLNTLLDDTKKSEQKPTTFTPKIRLNFSPLTKVGSTSSMGSSTSSADDNDDLLQAKKSLRKSHKSLVIRTFNDSNTSIFGKYNNELLEEAEASLRAENSPRGEHLLISNKSDPLKDVSNVSTPRSLTDYDLTETAPDPKYRVPKLKLQFDTSTSAENSPSNRIEPRLSKSSLETKRNSISDTFNGSLNVDDEDNSFVKEIEVNGLDHCDNPGGVVLTKPEYYMIPALKDLNQFMDDNNHCIVQGLTIGRRGYGNVYFPDPIEITNLNFDEIVHFRYREVIIYPDDTKKPPVGEGLNRRAQVTLDKVYPRKKGTSEYIIDVDEILKTNFVDSLMYVTQKHDCTFVDYRAVTGSWVFKANHFSKYGFTESDEEECEVGGERPPVIKPSEVLKLSESDQLFPKGPDELVGLTNGISKKKSPFSIPAMISDKEDFMIADDFYTDELYKTDSAIQDIKSSLFINLEMPFEDKFVTKRRSEKGRVESSQVEASFTQVITVPAVHKLSNISSVTLPEKVTTTQRVYTEMSVFKFNNFKVGWGKGCQFYTLNTITDGESTLGVNQVRIDTETAGSYNAMMPKLTEMLKITFEESDFVFDSNKVPTIQINRGTSFLERQTNLFNDHVKDRNLVGRERYLASIWNLCTSLWGQGDNSACARRQNVSDWLKQFSYDMSDEWSSEDWIEVDEKEALKTIFKQLSFHKISEACEFASRNKFSRLSLLLSQVSASERFKHWMQLYTNSYAWKQENVIDNEFKKLYLLLAGIPVRDNINTCEDLDWMRCFGLHLWYIAPLAAPIDVAFKLYKKAFTERYATAPNPHYCDSETQTSEYDLQYHLLALYSSSTYRLCNLLHPATHTENLMDYRLSWFLLQLFTSLRAGLASESDREHLHTTFATQLENMGLWKWAVFALLFLNNNTVKKVLITRILDRHLEAGRTFQIERDLVRMFKIPPSWIHEVKATKAKTTGQHYDYFQHNLYMKDYQTANNALVERILPELFTNEQFDDLDKFVGKLEPFASSLMNWHSQAGLIKDYFNLHAAVTDGVEGLSSIGAKLDSLIRRLNCFPLKNDEQKLCVAECSKKCALLFKLLYKDLSGEAFQEKFVDVLGDLVMPPDMKHYEVFHLIYRFVHN